MERKYTCLFYLNFHVRITETRTFYTFRLQINKKIIWRRNNLVCGIEFKLWLENCISNWHVARLYTYIHYTHFRTSSALIVLSRIRSASYSLCNAKHEKVITSIDSVNNYFVFLIIRGNSNSVSGFLQKFIESSLSLWVWFACVIVGRRLKEFVRVSVIVKK